MRIHPVAPCYVARKLKAHEAIVAWTPPGCDYSKRGQIRIGTFIRDDEPDWSAPYLCTDGAAWAFVRDLRGEEVSNYLLALFTRLTVCDGLDPKSVHKAFLGIHEYRDALRGTERRYPL